jgi:hypothetical protein
LGVGVLGEEFVEGCDDSGGSAAIPRRLRSGQGELVALSAAQDDTDRARSPETRLESGISLLRGDLRVLIRNSLSSLVGDLSKAVAYTPDARAGS